MKFGLGWLPHANGQKKFIYDTDKVLNGHILLFGSTGSGKTHTMKGLAKSLAYAGQGELRCIVFDVHGDIEFDDEWVSTCVIREQSKFGLQPLEVRQGTVFGGVHKAIKRFVYAINRSSTKLGVAQEALLKSLLYDLYWRNGFYPDDEKTWGLDYDPYRNRKWPKKFPTFKDLIFFAKSRQKQLFTGSSEKTVRAMENYAKKSVSLMKKKIDSKYTEEDVEAAKMSVLEAVEEFVNFPQDERLLDEYIKVQSKDTISSLINRLESIGTTGIFKENPAEFDPSKPIHRYDLRSLAVDEQKIFIELALSDIFLSGMARGTNSSLHTSIFIDEVKNYVQADDKQSMIVRMFNEARKFGIGMVLGSQNINHFPEDVITNAGVKLILGVDSTKSKAFSQKIGVAEEVLKSIEPQKSFLIEVKNKGEKWEFCKVLTSAPVA